MCNVMVNKLNDTMNDAVGNAISNVKDNTMDNAISFEIFKEELDVFIAVRHFIRRQRGKREILNYLFHSWDKNKMELNPSLTIKMFMDFDMAVGDRSEIEFDDDIPF